MLSDVRQRTIEPVITGAVAAGSLVHTDEYVVYARLPAWGYRHKTVCHGRGEYARDEDGDGFCEVHVNTIEGFWSLLRSWLRPHRGISQDKLPLYLGFFQFVHNARRRGKALRPSVRAPAPVTRFPGSAPGACVAGSRSPWPPSFAPSPPLPVPRFCSATSPLL